MVNVDGTLPAITLVTSTIAGFNTFSVAPGFGIRLVTNLAESLPSHSWEYGASAQSLLELYNPALSVYGSNPFPVPVSNITQVPALSYAASNIILGTGYSALYSGEGAAGDPSSLGVSAVMLGKTNKTFAQAADETVQGLLNDVPRFSNGAISHRANVPELWADFMYMVPPFLAYYAADKQDLQLLKDTVRQCQLYRQVLQPNTTAAYKGAWMHIIGPESQDTGIWSTGNGWAAAGMTRVLATVMKASFISDLAWKQQAIDNLTQYIKEIVDGSMNSSMDGGLLRNYLNDLDNKAHGFGEISGSSLIAATIYRMAVLQPQVFGSRYTTWADKIRTTLGGQGAGGDPHITAKGIATPAVNPLNWQDTSPVTTGSPEGQVFVVLMYAGWRDCVKAAKCSTGTGGSAERLNSSAVATDYPSRRRIHRGFRRHLSQIIHESSTS